MKVGWGSAKINHGVNRRFGMHELDIRLDQQSRVFNRSFITGYKVISRPTSLALEQEFAIGGLVDQIKALLRDIFEILLFA